MNYHLTETSSVMRDSDGAIIPADPRNIDWEEYQLWLSAGGEPLPANQPIKTDAELALIARQVRDALLLSICDPGILMAQRKLRMAIDPEQIAYATGKISELDIYTEALLAVPEQPGFPQTIIWPVAPAK